jgi:hypothetical protein
MCAIRYCNDAVSVYCVECGRPLGAYARDFRRTSSATASHVEPPSLVSTTASATNEERPTPKAARPAGANGGGTAEGSRWPPLEKRARFWKWVVVAALLLNIALFLGT